MEFHRHRTWVEAGIVAGFFAGLLLAVVETVLAGALGLGAETPGRWAASVILGEGALVADLPGFAIFVFATSAHVALMSLHGLVFAALMRRSGLSKRLGPLALAAAGTLFGVWVWLFHFQLLARAVMPWFLEPNQFTQLLVHALAFGLPLGLVFAWMERDERRPIEIYRPA